MEIRTNDRFCILTPLSPKLDKRESERIAGKIKEHTSLEIGLDLSFVNDCTIDFVESLSAFKLSAFNISSDVFALFNLMSVDKKINLYVSENDFEANKHRLLNRRFSIIQN